jgi:hypothetical protein
MKKIKNNRKKLVKNQVKKVSRKPNKVFNK